MALRSAPLLRGVLSRRGSSALILVSSVIAVAAAAAGPTFYRSAQYSILANAVHGAPAVGTGAEVNAPGPLDLLEPVTALVRRARDAGPAPRLLPQLEVIRSDG